MMPLASGDAVFALSTSTGIRYVWSYDTVSGGTDTFGNTAPADLPITTPASIGPGVGAQGVYRLLMQDKISGGTPSGAGGTQVTLYLTSSSNPFTTFLIPQGGSAVWDGGRPRCFNSAGVLQ